jgi:hypothetical protein
MLSSGNAWQIIVGVAQIQSNQTVNQLQQKSFLTTHLGSTSKEWGIMCLSGQKIHKNMVETYTS